MKKPARSPKRKTTATKTTGKKKTGTRRKPIMRHSREGRKSGSETVRVRPVVSAARESPARNRALRGQAPRPTPRSSRAGRAAPAG